MWSKITDPMWFNAVALVVLVIITGFYAWQTQKLVKEAREQRLLSIRPVLKVELVSKKPNVRIVGEKTEASLFLRVKNVGNGTMVSLEYTIIKPIKNRDGFLIDYSSSKYFKEPSIFLKEMVLGIGEKEDIEIGKLSEYEEKYPFFDVEIHYFDISRLGNKYIDKKSFYEEDIKIME